MLNLGKQGALAAMALAVLVAGAANAQSAPPEEGGPRSGPMGGKMFEKADANHDGFITLDELLAVQREHTEKMFREADTNHDGKLSHDEMHTWHEAMRARMMQRWAARRAQNGTPDGAALQQRNGGSILDANRPATPNPR